MGTESLVGSRSLLAEASPRPWYFDGWDVFSTGPTDDTSGHRLVFPLPHPTWHPSQRVTPADAEIAVRAVNEYEALLAVADNARAAVAVYPFPASPSSDIDWYMLALREALGGR